MKIKKGYHVGISLYIVICKGTAFCPETIYNIRTCYNVYHISMHIFIHFLFYKYIYSSGMKGRRHGEIKCMDKTKGKHRVCDQDVHVCAAVGPGMKLSSLAPETRK